MWNEMQKKCRHCSSRRVIFKISDSDVGGNIPNSVTTIEMCVRGIKSNIGMAHLSFTGFEEFEMKVGSSGAKRRFDSSQSSTRISFRGRGRMRDPSIAFNRAGVEEKMRLIARPEANSARGGRSGEGYVRKMREGESRMFSDERESVAT